jgi:nitrous oxidase accessory protein
MHRGLTLFLLPLVILSVLVAGGTARGEQTPSCTIFVQPGKSIQAAINEAPPGAVICLPAGEWREHLTIGKSLTLRGERGAIVYGYENEVPVIRVYNPTEGEVVVVLEKLGLTTSATWLTSGIVVEAGVQAAIVGCQIVGSWSGIWVQGSAQASIDGCEIYACDTSGILLTASAQASIADCVFRAELGDDIALKDSAQATIVSCTLLNSRAGVWATNSAQVTIDDCAISESDMGIWAWASSQIRITRCAISGNDYGISLLDSARVTLTGGNITGSRMTGILLQDSCIATIADCTISENGLSGVDLWDSSQATIDGCDISRNEIGCRIRDSSQVRIIGCTVRENRYYGVTVAEGPCAFGLPFNGHVIGGGNVIPGWGEEQRNERAAVCPYDLRFLMTEAGGEFDRRE